MPRCFETNCKCNNCKRNVVGKTSVPSYQSKPTTTTTTTTTVPTTQLPPWTTTITSVPTRRCRYGSSQSGDFCVRAAQRRGVQRHSSRCFLAPTPMAEAFCIAYRWHAHCYQRVRLVTINLVSRFSTAGRIVLAFRRFHFVQHLLHNSTLSPSLLSSPNTSFQSDNHQPLARYL